MKICLKYYSETFKIIPNYVKLDRAKTVFLYGNLETKIRAIEERELWAEMQNYLKVHDHSSIS